MIELKYSIILHKYNLLLSYFNKILTYHPFSRKIIKILLLVDTLKKKRDLNMDLSSLTLFCQP